MKIASQDGITIDSAGAPVVRTGLRRRLPCGYIRIGSGIAIPAVLREFDVQFDVLLQHLRMPASIFDHPDNALPFAVFCRLISLCIEATARDDFGFLICETLGAANFGLVGLLLQQAPDVRTALTDLVRNLHHHDRGAMPFVKLRDGVVAFGYLISQPALPAAHHIYDGALAIGRNIMRAFCGPNWTPVEVMLSRKRPASTTRHERFYGAPVCFSAERNAISFREEWLDTPIRGADPMLHQMLQEQVDLLEAEETINVTEQVRRLLRTAALTSGASFGDISELLHLNRRTLGRHLDAEGTSFKKLSEEVHFDIARHLLANTAMSVTDIGLVLNYSQASSFTRAFHGWSGRGPREWRAVNSKRDMLGID